MTVISSCLWHSMALEVYLELASQSFKEQKLNGYELLMCTQRPCRLAGWAVSCSIWRHHSRRATDTRFTVGLAAFARNITEMLLRYKAGSCLPEQLLDVLAMMYAIDPRCHMLLLLLFRCQPCLLPVRPTGTSRA